MPAGTENMVLKSIRLIRNGESVCVCGGGGGGGR